MVWVSKICWGLRFQLTHQLIVSNDIHVFASSALPEAGPFFLANKSSARMIFRLVIHSPPLYLILPVVSLSTLVIVMLNWLAYVFAGYTLSSYVLRRNPCLLHKRKRFSFRACHISHRGGAGEQIENSMEAFTRCVAVTSVSTGALCRGAGTSFWMTFIPLPFDHLVAPQSERTCSSWIVTWLRTVKWWFSTTPVSIVLLEWMDLCVISISPNYLRIRNDWSFN